ncbi:NADPH-dependent FMN reductase [Embleya sp. NPDC050493]|uniref:NADPH-dependent FMN reductase n=1 Tax=Embleya sp. NPDC050493 TaxID=3363989 RepID=UPI0037B09A4E
MATVLTVWGSPSATSRTGVVARHVAARLAADGHDVSTLAVRDLPAQALLHADFADPHLRAALARVAEADALVIASPVYKAAYSGVLKTFLDVLPQFALRGKEILPVLTGGTPAHVLALDYALRPVLTSLGADHVAQGWFVHERFVSVEGGIEARNGIDAQGGPDAQDGITAQVGITAAQVGIKALGGIEAEGIAPLDELADAFSARLRRLAAVA